MGETVREHEQDVILAVLASVAAVCLALVLRSTKSLTNVAAWCARGFYTAFIVMLGKYISQHRDGWRSLAASEDGGAGSRHSAETVLSVRRAFNYHPMFMSVAFLVLLTEGVLAFRGFPMRAATNSSSRVVHTVFNTGATILAGAGLIVAIRFHRGGYVGSPGVGVPIHGELDHFESAHSWLGLATMLLVGLQIALGVRAVIGTAVTDDDPKVHLIEYHRYYGLVTYLTAIFAIEMGLYKFIDADQTRYDNGERRMGELSLLLWGTGVCTVAHFMLFDSNHVRAFGAPRITERSTLIQG